VNYNFILFFSRDKILIVNSQKKRFYQGFSSVSNRKMTHDLKLLLIWGKVKIYLPCGYYISLPKTFNLVKSRIVALLEGKAHTVQVSIHIYHTKLLIIQNVIHYLEFVGN